MILTAKIKRNKKCPKYTLLELFGKHSSLLFAYRKIKLHFLLYFDKITLETWGFLQPLLMPATRNTK